MFLMDLPKYSQYVLDPPKGYHMFIIYAASPQFCGICKPFIDAFQRTALSYYMAGASEIGGEQKPAYFAYVDFGTTQDIPRMHGMTTLPHIVHIEGGKYEVSGGKDGILRLPERMFPVVKLDISPREILDWINKETSNKDIGLYMSPQEKAMRWVLILVGAIAVIAAGVQIILVCRRRPGVIAVVGLIIHYIATSGIFYNLLQGMQWMGRDPQGGLLFIMNNARGQYLAEGLTMSALTICSGLSLFAASRLPFTERGRKMDASQMMYAMGTLVGVSIMTMTVVILAYIQKAGWYSANEFAPPEHYRRGPLRIDQGNSF
jgi:hypothetical protein